MLDIILVLLDYLKENPLQRQLKYKYIGPLTENFNWTLTLVSIPNPWKMLQFVYINTVSWKHYLMFLIFGYALSSCYYFTLKVSLSWMPLYTNVSSHPWLQKFCVTLCGTLNGTLDPAVSESKDEKKNDHNVFALNHKALKFNGNEVSGAVLCSRTGGVMMLRCQELWRHIGDAG